jgi:hypothetical protein
LTFGIFIEYSLDVIIHILLELPHSKCTYRERDGILYAQLFAFLGEKEVL